MDETKVITKHTATNTNTTRDIKTKVSEEKLSFSRRLPTIKAATPTRGNRTKNTRSAAITPLQRFFEREKKLLYIAKAPIKRKTSAEMKTMTKRVPPFLFMFLFYHQIPLNATEKIHI